MTTRMLIDARHQEETRVAVVQGNRIEEFDFESAEHKQIKGNIFLAKVTRVEPSLQAAFIDYGGNRHGFLAFSEIHPDYYQIPKADRDALLQEEAEHAAEEERLRAEEDARHDDPDDDFQHDDEDDSYQAASADDGSIEQVAAPYSDDDDLAVDAIDAVEPVGEVGLDDDHLDEMEPSHPEEVGARTSNPADELRKKRQALRRRYKIQDVIHRRQVLLVQVVKEERGNKGAALTTYLSLAGRYCVLMPNTSSGGGISRKISNGADRKRLKSIMADLQLPKSMGCIVRTAGLQRTRTEIKRDFDYLARMWDEIREKTLSSSAPALIYGDSDLVKRAIRDIYNKEIDEVIVEGEGGFRAARTFMKLLMPTHARKIAAYQDAVPLFQRYGVEDQLSAMYQPVVQLKSGGYLVINPTEALVSIDINSGRSTREHNIEQTAYATNIEAAHEIARQLRLRDMAGLVVIDFIDMESSGNIRRVEKAMKDALRNDRARIQVGRISGFGLMEMSRQRLRTGVLEASTRVCEHCEGTGLMRTASSAGLSALRMLEDEAARGRGDRICLRAGREAAIYVLNKKRGELAEVEERYGVSIEVLIDPNLEGARMTVESAGNRPIARAPLPASVLYEDDDDDLLPLEEEEEEIFADDAPVEDGPDTERSERPARTARDEDEDATGRKRRRRRRSRGGRRDEAPATDEVAAPLLEGEPSEEGDVLDAEFVADGEAAPIAGETREDAESARRRRGRRGRRGGRGRNPETASFGGDAEGGDTGGEMNPSFDAEVAIPTEALLAPDADIGIAAIAPAGDDAPDALLPQAEAQSAEDALGEEERPKTRRRPRAKKPVAAEAPTDDAPANEAMPVAAEDEAPAKPKRSRRKVVADVLEAPRADDAAPDQPTAAQLAAAALDGEDAPAEALQAKAGAKQGVSDQPAVSLVDATSDTPTVTSSIDAAAQDAAAEDGEPGEAGKSRSGWWQRTFG